MKITRLNDPGLISREVIYSGLSRSEKSRTVESTFRRFCYPHLPTIVTAPMFLDSYNAVYTSYRTADTSSYSDQFIFFFTPVDYTEIAIIAERLYGFIESITDLAGHDVAELRQLERSLQRMFEKRDDLMYSYREDPTLIQRVPSLVIVFEQIYPGGPDIVQAHNFVGVFQGTYNQLCHTK